MITKRNTHNIGFNDEEFVFIAKKAKRLGLYPRQYIMQLIRNDK